MRKFCIINTCGREDCGNHEQVHEDGAYYLVQDVDAHLAGIEQADNIWHEQTRQQTEALNTRIHDLESGLRELLQDTQHANHNCGDGPDLCPVARARELLGLMVMR